MKLKPPMLLGVALAALATVTLLGTTDTVHAQTFTPSATVVIADPTAGANSDFTTDYSLPEGDVNFAALIFFIAPEWGITPGDEIPIGAIVGELKADARIGLINGQCSNSVAPEFQMLNASIDITDTIDFEDTDDSGRGDVFEDEDGSGLQDGIEKYPSFINRITGDAQPIRRAAGVEIIAGADVLLQFLVFEPGTSVISEVSSDASLGYPAITFLQNIGDPESIPVPGPITDFCTPLITSNVTFGVSKDNACTDNVPVEELEPLCEAKSRILDIPEEPVSDPDESGIPLFTNPSEGTYTFNTIVLGQRDADGDGIENSLDTCPFDANLGDPRIKGDGDADEDGLDTACDPNDDEINSDEDLDGYMNRQDNCPLIANGEEEDNQDDDDVNEAGDERPDGIGNACDPNPTVPDGDMLSVQLASEVTIGPGSGPGPQDTPTDGDTPATDEDDDGGGAILIIIGIIAAIVVVGGGAFVLLRRTGGGA